MCRALHFFGTTGGLVILVAAVYFQQPLWLIGMPLCGYGAAWIGHFIIEKNRPATFTYPLWSLRGDFIMWSHMLPGRLWSEDVPAFQKPKVFRFKRRMTVSTFLFLLLTSSTNEPLVAPGKM